MTHRFVSSVRAVFKRKASAKRLSNLQLNTKLVTGSTIQRLLQHHEGARHEANHLMVVRVTSGALWELFTV